jgi:O-acetylhomoserine (thiol)-lyase
MSDKKNYGFTTTILHNDRRKPIEQGSLHKPVHTSVAFGYGDARQLASVFQGKEPGFRYGRQGNPTVAALEDKITKMEDGVATPVLRHRHGGHRRAVPGAAEGRRPYRLVELPVREHQQPVADGGGAGRRGRLRRRHRCRERRSGAAPKTRLVFVETIANPRTQVADLARIGELCRARGILYVVDNTMTTPYLFRPKAVGAGLVVNSLTKSIGGHGIALGGALTDTGLFDWSAFPNIAANFRKQPPAAQGMAQLRAKALRDFGAALGPEAAHHIAVGAETLALRMERTCANALALAQMLEADERVAAVHYPGLASHPQHGIAPSCSAPAARCSASS